MTSEQLAHLREWTERWGGVSVAFVYSDTILRLIDEREALLAALRAVEWGGDSFQGFASVCPDCVGRADQGHTPDCVLAAAIVKAES